MSSNKNSYPIPDGYKEIEFQTEHHIDHIGKGFHKKDAEGNLVMAFYVKPENGNSGGVAHGGMLMSIADYSLCSAAMESREKYVATISFRSEFISGAKIGRKTITMRITSTTIPTYPTRTRTSIEAIATVAAT